MGYLLNIPVCHRCPLRQRPCNGPCACLVAGRDILDMAAAGDCPEGFFVEGPDPQLPGGVPAQPIDPSRPEYTGFDGSALWALLHAAPAATQDVVDAVTAGLSCGPCRTGWLAMLAATPPPLGDLPAFRVWAYERHEEVNAKISKPLMTYDQAAARWGWET